MHSRRNKPIMLNSVEVQMIKIALLDWREPQSLTEEKAALLNALQALEYIDTKDKVEEQSALCIDVK